MPGNQISKRGRASPIRHSENVNVGHHLEQFGGHMTHGPDASRRHADLARIGLGISDKFRNGLGGKRWIDHHDKGHPDDSRHRCNVAYEIEIELVVERCVDRVGIGDKEKRIAVRRCIHDRLGADVAAATRAIVDNDGLAEPFRQPLSYQTRDNIWRAAGASGDDPAQQACRIGLRPRDMRKGWERGSARGQMQKFPARKFHLPSLSPASIGSFPPRLSRAGVSLTVVGHSPLMFAALRTGHHLSISAL